MKVLYWDLIPFLFFLFSGISGAAQSTYFGAQAGVNLCSIDGHAEEIEADISYYVGLYASRQLAGRFNFQPAILFSSQKFTQNSRDEIHSTRYYINMPLYLNITLTESFALIFGPQLSTLIDAKAEADGVSVNTTSMLNPIDISVGAGFNVSLMQKLILQGDYHEGLMNTLRRSDGDSRYRNRAFRLGLIYKLSK